MCIGGGSPSPPPPPAVAPLVPPPTPQIEKAPDLQASYSNKRKTGNGANATGASGKMAGGTLLTGPSGVDNSLLTTGKTLLGA